MQTENFIAEQGATL